MTSQELLAEALYWLDMAHITEWRMNAVGKATNIREMLEKAAEYRRKSRKYAAKYHETLMRKGRK